MLAWFGGTRSCDGGGCRRVRELIVADMDMDKLVLRLSSSLSLFSLSLTSMTSKFPPPYQPHKTSHNPP